MSINYAILGILSWKAMTGYDLKKIVQQSSFMYWSANNNQIYRSLVELLADGYVTYEIQHQDSSPSKKIYTITEAGLTELKQWVLSTPQAPESKKMFLIQLAWAHELDQAELEALLDKYENELRLQLLAHNEKQRRHPVTPARTERETYLWNMIEENLRLSYETELAWLQKIRAGLGGDTQEVKK